MRPCRSVSRIAHQGLTRSKTTLVEDAFGIPPQHQIRRVVVTGLGLVTPLGIGLQRAWGNLLVGHCGICKLTPEDLPPGHAGALDKLPSRVAAVVPGEEYSSALAAAGISAKGSRFVNFAELAAREALQDAEWAPVSEAEHCATGVAIGSGLSCTSELAEAGVHVMQGAVRKISPFLVTRILANSPAGAVSIRHGFRGPNLAPATACAAGADAIGNAFRLIRTGDADVMLAGGTEACVDAVALAAFGRMGALSARYNDDPCAASRPFDAARCGFVLGEGAGALVLEELSHALARGAPHIYAEVGPHPSMAAWDLHCAAMLMSADAHHIMAPPPEGSGAALAMRNALRDGGLAPADVAYVNAHGTGTPLGDVAKLRAIASAFGGAACAKSAGASSSRNAEAKNGSGRGVGSIVQGVQDR